MNGALFSPLRAARKSYHVRKRASLLRAGASHNPMRILKVDRPIFHFSVITKTAYEGVDTYE